MTEYLENDLSKKIEPSSHGPFIYIYQSHDCCVFSLVTVLGNMYNLCRLHYYACITVT